MTITGIDSTGQSPGGNVLPPRGSTDAKDLEAELRALETDVQAAPISVIPAARTNPDEEVEPLTRPRVWRTLTWRDLLAVASFIAVALFITGPLWLNLDHGLADDPQDQAFFEWMLAHGARVLTDGAYPFFSDRMNYPDGVNMMANTSVLAVSLPMTPVTLLFGAHVSFNVFLTLALAATGISWYFVLSRQFVTWRLAAWVGALFCTFAPSMVSHAGGHPNIVSQFLVPLIIWRTLELRAPGRMLRNGLILGGLLVWQAFINLEILFMTAVGLGIFCVAMWISRRRRHPGEAGNFVRGLAVAAISALAVLAYPLCVQFFGPQSYHGLPEFVRNFGADLGSFTAYSQRSVAGNPVTAGRLAQNAAEQNAFFGWGLVILFFGLVAWMRRSVAVVTLAVVALLFAALSLGPFIYLNGINTGIPGLWGYLHSVPVLNSAVPTRWAMAIAPVVGIVLALGCQRASDLVRSQPSARGPVRVAMITAVAMADAAAGRPDEPDPEFRHLRHLAPVRRRQAHRRRAAAARQQLPRPVALECRHRPGHADRRGLRPAAEREPARPGRPHRAVRAAVAADQRADGVDPGGQPDPGDHRHPPRDDPGRPAVLESRSDRAHPAGTRHRPAARDERPARLPADVEGRRLDLGRPQPGRQPRRGADRPRHQLALESSASAVTTNVRRVG
jgi:hypothetical protein